MILLLLIFMIAFTVLAFQVILWQSADISVSIVSENDDGSNEVTISVLNTAGSTLLFYENNELTGKIEYLNENGEWMEYCDVRYTTGNTSAISQQYGGTFAELEPGEAWDISVPKDKVLLMQNGTYRIVMTYVTESEYNDYLDNAFENRTESDEPEISDGDIEINTRPFFGNLSVKDELSITEEFLAESECEVFIKTFKYTAPEDFVGSISIDDSQIANDSRNRLIDKPVY